MNRPEQVIRIEKTTVSLEHPTYFIADISANHDGDLGRAKELVFLAAEAGANAAKFQHFQAETIVSDFGFKSLGGQASHQAKWKKSVFEVYKDASVDPSWTETLKKACDEAGVTFFTTPYSPEIVDQIDPYVPAYKIGSGDITWLEIIRKIASKNKPYLIAAGASSSDDVVRAMAEALSINPQVCLMQCNTNYTGNLENFKYIQLNVLKVFAAMYPGIILGLSDHTPGHSTVLGAVALGARMIEKHFTDDTSRIGPDHAFSMDPKTWKEMVDRTRELEYAMGNGIKKIEENEKETVILQRRALRTRHALSAGHRVQPEDLIALRPCPADAILPFEADRIVGKNLARALQAGESFKITDFSGQ